MSEGADKDHHYRGYGLNIRSELPLPELLPAQPGLATDLSIRLARTGEAGFEPEPPHRAEPWEFAPAIGGGHVLAVPEVGHFNVRDGRQIVVRPCPETDAGFLRLFLLGSAMGMALHQRGDLVLHGATVLNPLGTATLFVGESGAGKSTMAAALGRAGLPILGDDTMALRRTSRGFEAWPGSRVFKLWQDTLRHLGEPTEGLEKIQNRMDKFFWPNGADAPDRPALLAEVVLLERAPDGAEPEFAELDGLEALRLVAQNTYRPAYVSLLGRNAEHFRDCAALAQMVRVGRLSRPRDLGRLDEGVALVRAHWERAAALSVSP